MIYMMYKKFLEVKHKIMQHIKKKYNYYSYSYDWIYEEEKDEYILNEKEREERNNIREDLWVKDVFTKEFSSKVFGPKHCLVIIVLKDDFNS